ncbi:Rhodanese-related sulfurtransferase [hydrothermal vent metagenome]|uniref:Rhodanese-related sulfurtransferase n=1 Tax=hydrothermal vent metagenome TaxID=652676 RepID=A0A3B0Y5D4_9ZZZZ
MKKYTELVQAILSDIDEIFPWDLEELIASNKALILLDIREQDEFQLAKIAHSINVPRGILEGACDWGYDDTIPALAAARDQAIVVICRSGNRSALAAYTMQQMGFSNTQSLKTGLRGWNDSEQLLFNSTDDVVDIDAADALLSNKVRDDQKEPKD